MNTHFAMSSLPRTCMLAFAVAAVAATTATTPARAEEPALLDAAALRMPATSLPTPAHVSDNVLLTTPLLTPVPARWHAPLTSEAGQAMEAVAPLQLEHERGRADTVLNDTRLNGEVANNSAFNVQTGSNSIDAGSFANMSGIPVVIQNSGANVLIQNATVINLQFQ
jgi:hypothetical protein